MPGKAGGNSSVSSENSKRKNSEFLQDDKEASTTSLPSFTTKKSRHCRTPADNSKWDKGLPVFVKTAHHGWVRGEVFKRHMVDGGPDFTVTVHVKDFDGNMVIPRTIKRHNQDPIPSNEIHNYLREAPPQETDDLPSFQQKIYACFQHFADNNVSAEDVDLKRLSILERDMVSPDSPNNLISVLFSLQKRKDVRKHLKLLAGEDSSHLSLIHLGMYFFGQLSGIQLEKCGSNDKNWENNIINLLGDKITSNKNMFHSLKCSYLKVFLGSVMFTRLKKVTDKTVNAKGGLYDNRALNKMLLDNNLLEQRLTKLHAAITCIYSSQRDRGNGICDAEFDALYNGVRMMLDLKGLTDEMINEISKTGICLEADVLRRHMHKIVEKLNIKNYRSQHNEGLVPVVVNCGCLAM